MIIKAIRFVKTKCDRKKKKKKKKKKTILFVHARIVVNDDSFIIFMCMIVSIQI